MEGIPHIVQQQPIHLALQKHKSMSRVALRACKLTPLKLSMAKMMQEQKWHKQTLTSHMCMHAPPHTRTYAHIPV